MTTMQIIDVEEITRSHQHSLISIPAGPERCHVGKLLGYKDTPDAVLVKIAQISPPTENPTPTYRLNHHSMITIFDPSDDVPDSYLTDI